MLDYTPIFNKMTVETFDKFTDKYRIRCKKGNTKEEYQNGLLDSFQNDMHAESQFQEFYKQLEEAGRKHYFLFRFEAEDIIQDKIESNIIKYTDEANRTFDPVKDDGKTYFRKEENFYIFKQFNIKKTFRFKDEKENEEKNEYTRRYTITKIHFVKFVQINFVKRIIVCGHDSYGDLENKQEYKKELFDFLESIIGNMDKLESVLTSSSIDDLIVLPNCLSYSIRNTAKIHDIATFKKDMADYEQIKRDLKAGKYRIDEIKDKNPDFDLKTNVLYNAGLEASYDSNFSLTNDCFEFFYFTDASGLISYFRIKFDTRCSSIVTYSDSVTKTELWDVFRRIT